MSLAKKPKLASDSESSSFVVRDFLQKVTKDEKQLDALADKLVSATSGRDVYNKIRDWPHKVQDDLFGPDFLTAVFQAVQEPKTLEGEVLYVSTPHGIPDQFVETGPNVVVEAGRNPPILVMGSSGSGKTSYCVKMIPKLLNEVNEQKPFVVFMDANSAFHNRTKDGPHDAGLHMAAKIEQAIAKHGGVDAMEFTMIVIVDEVGLQLDKKYVGTNGDIQELLGPLRDLAKQVRLVLSGTGLDLITSMVNSEQEAIKIRLAPWDKDQVHRYIRQVCQTDIAPSLSKLIESTPLYTSLSGNPRALSYLTKTLQQQLHIREEQTINQDFVVATVTDFYISQNGLANLSRTEKRDVVMLVWKALVDVKYDEVEIPDLFGPERSPSHRQLESCFHSLVDVNLESKIGVINLTEGHHYAISITSAVSLILVALTGNIAPLCRNWEQFETIVALHELQFSYVNSYPSRPWPIKVVASRTQFPGGQKGYVLVPHVDNSIIVVNGPKAAYADVISLGRLVQAKHTENDSISLNLFTELQKLGVWKVTQSDSAADVQGTVTTVEASEKVLKNTALVTALLRKRWAGNTSDHSAAHDVQPATLTVKRNEGPIILPGETRHGPSVSKLSHYSKKMYVVPFSSEDFSSPLEDQNHPISVVFVTNAKQFKIPAKSCELGCDTYILRSHVDKNGELLLENDVNHGVHQFFQNNLLEAVSVKFIFLEQDEK